MICPDIFSSTYFYYILLLCFLPRETQEYIRAVWPSTNCDDIACHPVSRGGHLPQVGITVHPIAATFTFSSNE